MIDDNNGNDPRRERKRSGQFSGDLLKSLEQSAEGLDPIVDGFDQLLCELQDFALDSFVEARQEAFDLRREELLKLAMTLTNTFGSLATKRAAHVKMLRKV